MDFDAEELAEDGYDLAVLADVIDYARLGLQGQNSKEAEWLRNYLDNMQEECGGHAL